MRLRRGERGKDSPVTQADFRPRNVHLVSGMHNVSLVFSDKYEPIGFARSILGKQPPEDLASDADLVRLCRIVIAAHGPECATVPGMNTARLLGEQPVLDPDSGAPVDIAIFKHSESGGIFAIDASFLGQCFEDEQDPVIQDPFNDGSMLRLLGT